MSAPLAPPLRDASVNAVRRIHALPHELALLDAISASARVIQESLGAVAVVVWLARDRQELLVRHVGLHDVGAAALARRLSTQATAQLVDLAAQPELAALSSARPRLAGVYAPLRSEGGAREGIALLVERDEVSIDDLPCVEAIAGTVGLVVSTVRAAEEAQREAVGSRLLSRRTAELTALQRIANVLGSKLDLREVLESSLDFAEELVGPEGSALYLLREESQEFELFLQRHHTRSAATVDRFSAWDPRLVGAFCRRRSLVLTVDDAHLSSLERSTISAFGFQECVLVPLFVGQRVNGVLMLGFDKSGLSSTMRDTMVAIGEQLALAIDRARVHQLVDAAALESDRLRKAVEAERHHLSQVIDRLPFPIAVIDQAHRFRQANTAYCDFMGVDPQRGDHWQNVRERLSNRDGSPVKEGDLAVLRALAGEETPPIEKEVQTHEGRRSVVAWAIPLRDEGGAVGAAVLAFQDITSLRELSEAKDRFFAIASHELRGPLSNLNANLYLLESERGSNEVRRAQLAERLHRQVKRMCRLVDDLIDSARMREGSLSIAPAPMDLTTVVLEEIEAASREWPNHRIELEGAATMVGSWDRERLAQVVANLLSNALRYSPERQEINVSVTQEGSNAILSVRDRGIGIALSERATLFDPYTRSRVAGSLAPNGLGLGLYISREIVRRHGGEITVDSEAGHGSRFLVTLPLS